MIAASSLAAVRYLIASVLVVIAAHVLGYFVVGCSSWFQTYDDVYEPSVDGELSRCRTLARAEHQIYGDADRAWNVYVECTRDAGLR